MSEQPEALRLAEMSEQLAADEALLHCWPWPLLANLYKADAAELRRLHALCEEMGKALERSDKELGLFAGYHRDGPTRSANAAALAKWKESK